MKRLSLILGVLSWRARQGSEGDCPLCTEMSWHLQQDRATATGDLRDHLTDEKGEAQEGSGLSKSY